jgi:hypothetical protein
MNSCKICFITHTKEDNYKTPCGHDFGISCLLGWINYGISCCPYCLRGLDCQKIRNCANKRKITYYDKLMANTTIHKLIKSNPKLDELKQYNVGSFTSLTYDTLPYNRSNNNILHYHRLSRL